MYDRVRHGCPEGIAVTIYPRPTCKGTTEVGDIRPHTETIRGFTMKFDWHLTVVRFIMAAISRIIRFLKHRTQSCPTRRIICAVRVTEFASLNPREYSIVTNAGWECLRDSGIFDDNGGVELREKIRRISILSLWSKNFASR